MDWSEVTLAEVCGKPQYGAIAKGTAAPIGPKFVRQTDIVSGRIDWNSVPFCDLDQSDVSKYAIQPGDLLISRLGAGVGTAATVREAHNAVFAGYLVRFQADEERACPEFLGYQLSSQRWRQHVAGYRSGAAQPTLNAQQMGAFRFRLPPLVEQRGIAATLGALDDKIESNRRVIAGVQELSRAIYRDWRERHPAVLDTRFGDWVDVFGGATPKTSVSEFWEGGIAWATPSDITALSAPYLFDTSRKITVAGLEGVSALMHPAGSIFMTSRATIGAFAVNQIPATTNQGFIVVRPRVPEHQWFLFEEMRARVSEFLDNANGSTFLELSRGRFKELSLEVPDDHALRELDGLLSPLHEKAVQTARETGSLESMRDALLPELLSGRIRVPEAAEAVAEATA
jgi:type I restriction enzyme S subunit